MRNEVGVMGLVGAAGFIGGELARQAAAAGWRVAGFSRSRREGGGAVAEWREWSEQPDFSGLTALVNLAGEPIDQRWTAARKRNFHASRVGVTGRIASALAKMAQPPEVWLNGSAVGIYGDRGDEILEDGAAQGGGYLAELCAAWEAAAVAERTRVLKWRTGIVLGRDGAAWKKMRLAFSLGAGGRFGDGRQWMPWIHVEDLAAGMLHAIGAGMSGPVNASAPEPERNADFTKKLARALGRPAFFHAPGPVLKLALGGFGEALLSSQRAVPRALLESGFRFRFPSLEMALRELAARA